MGFTSILPHLNRNVGNEQPASIMSRSARHMLASGHDAAALSFADMYASSATALLLAEESDGLQSQQRVFEASLPDSSALVAMGVVLVLCVVAGLVWANEVVPVSRTKVRARA